MPRTSSSASKPWWVKLPQGELLDVPICDLKLELAGTALEQRIVRLNRELERAHLRFRPHIWLSTDWFTPDGVTGFAIPFFLAHPRLARLEARHMLEVEGGDQEWCMRLLRHETAHALDNAFNLHRKKRWREAFGKFSEPYREDYRPEPLSRDYVLNLDGWYAQSHPGEDWAETFSVWLQPGARWRKKYADWPAINKLNCVDELMQEIAGQPPSFRNRERVDALPSLKMTLREYYRKKQAHYSEDNVEEFDNDLKRIFSADPLYADRRSASGFLIRHGPLLQRRVCAVTQQHPYLIKQVYNEMLRACRRLGLRLTQESSEARIDVAVLITTLTQSFVRGARGEFRR